MRTARKGRFGALFCLLLAGLVHAQATWDDVRRSAIASPEAAERIIARKMREDWPGFLALLAKHPGDDAFFEVVLRSINPTLGAADLHEIDALAHKSCTSAQRAQCDAIAKEAATALKDAQ